MNYAGKSYLAPLAKIGAVGSAILLGITVLLTGGFAVIDLLEGDRWVGELWWWRNLIAGTAGLVVLIKTVQYSIRASPSKKTRAYLIATAINLTSCVVLLTVKAMMPSLPMVL
jgi:hypothetical protein